MRHIEALSEHEMVAAFLKAEIASERFGSGILALLRRDGQNRSIIDEPDIRNERENAYGIKLLGDFRGYRQGRELFHAFPEDVCWHRYALSGVELARVKYIDYSYWNELSGGSRLAVDAARNIRAAAVVFGQSTKGFLDIARTLEGGAKFPELILAGAAPEAELVVLEGHVRLTAYLLVPWRIPDELTAIIGLSPGIVEWGSDKAA